MLVMLFLLCIAVAAWCGYWLGSRRGILEALPSICSSCCVSITRKGERFHVEGGCHRFLQATDEDASGKLHPMCDGYGWMDGRV